MFTYLDVHPVAIANCDTAEQSDSCGPVNIAVIQQLVHARTVHARTPIASYLCSYVTVGGNYM